MASNDAFFREAKGAQTALKHAILKSYLATFAGATGTHSPGNRVGFLDGYAGPGEYISQTTGLTNEGSPRIALTIAKNQLERRRNLECIFVEKNPKHFAMLKAMVDAAETPALAFRGDVKDHLVAALDSFSTLPALVFLDPFGAALEREASIDAILRRPGDQPTELLLNFSVQTVRRAGARIKEREGSQGREATIATMDRWLGGDWWQPYFLDSHLNGDASRADIAANLVVQEYARRVCASTSCGVFSVDMRRSAGHKPLFALMLFFPRALAAFKYNEAVSLAQDAWRTTMWGMDIARAEREDEHEIRMGMSRADEMREAFKADKEQYRLDAISTIKNTIIDTLRKQPTVSVEREFSKVFGAAAGQGRTLHLRAAWAQLAEEGVTGPVPVGKFDRAVIASRATTSFGPIV